MYKRTSAYKRTNIFLTEKQKKHLRKLSEYDGLSQSEHIRRAIDEYFSKKIKFTYVNRKSD